MLSNRLSSAVRGSRWSTKLAYLHWLAESSPVIFTSSLRQAVQAKRQKETSLLQLAQAGVEGSISSSFSSSSSSSDSSHSADSLSLPNCWRPKELGPPMVSSSSMCSSSSSSSKSSRSSSSPSLGIITLTFLALVVIIFFGVASGIPCQCSIRIAGTPRNCLDARKGHLQHLLEVGTEIPSCARAGLLCCPKVEAVLWPGPCACERGRPNMSVASSSNLMLYGRCARWRLWQPPKSKLGSGLADCLEFRWVSVPPLAENWTVKGLCSQLRFTVGSGLAAMGPKSDRCRLRFRYLLRVGE
ncbi:hypothetical protein KC351_g11 [Hortaea werneckii]|nr:hypothetical protein KC351_g11 [Hortaea werneckii]